MISVVDNSNGGKTLSILNLSSGNGSFKYEVLHIFNVRVGPKSVRVDFKIGNEVNTLYWEWETDNSFYLFDRNYLLQVFNLVINSVTSLFIFSKKITLDFTSRFNSLFEECGFEQTKVAISLFLDTFIIERNNVRYALSSNSSGYSYPSTVEKEGIDSFIGSECEVDSGTAMYPELSPIKPFNWDEHQLSCRSQVVINISMGKESMVTSYFMEKLYSEGKLLFEPLYSVFLHRGKANTPSDLDKINIGRERVQVIESNFLEIVLEKFIEVKMGTPVCMLVQTFEKASQLAYYAMGIDYILSGDEFERSTYSYLSLASSCSPVKVHSYNYGQSPGYAAKENYFQQLIGGIYKGSLLYGMLGGQAQWLLEYYYDKDSSLPELMEVQKSCRRVGRDMDSNCNSCYKCKRVELFKNLYWSSVPFYPDVYTLDDFYSLGLDADFVPAEIHEVLLNFMWSFQDRKGGLHSNTYYSNTRPAVLAPELHSYLVADLKTAV